MAGARRTLPRPLRYSPPCPWRRPMAAELHRMQSRTALASRGGLARASSLFGPRVSSANFAPRTSGSNGHSFVQRGHSSVPASAHIELTRGAAVKNGRFLAAAGGSFLRAASTAACCRPRGPHETRRSMRFQLCWHSRARASLRDEHSGSPSMGSGRRSGTSCGASLPFVGRRGQHGQRTRFIHRPARDNFRPGRKLKFRSGAG
jgi:hypothetical protein